MPLLPSKCYKTRIILQPLFSLFHFWTHIESFKEFGGASHAFMTYVQINHFGNYRCDCLLWHLVKMAYDHINNYKMVWSCICNLYLQLMSIWMKMKMKNINIIHLQWHHKIDETVFVLQLGRQFIGHWTPHGIFSTWFAIMNPSCKCM